MRPPKQLIMFVLVVQMMFVLSGCVVVLNNNWGSNIRVMKKHDLSDATIVKEFDSTLDVQGRR